LIDAHLDKETRTECKYNTSVLFA